MKIEGWKEPTETPRIAVDPLIVKGNKIVLIRRKIEPFKGMLDFPGGMLEYGETVEHAVVREAKEETGLKVKVKDILGVYSSPERDPRMHILTIPFVVKPISKKLKGSYEGEPEWYDINKINFKDLGFDHAKILRDYLEWRKRKGTYWSTK